MQDKVQVILKPHIGMQDSDAGPVPFEHDQWMVYFTAPPDLMGEKFIGYLPKAVGKPFLPTATFIEQPAGLQGLIVEAVSVAAGDPRPLGITPLPRAVLEEYVRQQAGETDDAEEDESEEQE